jgi:phosphoribosyl 1,2-cyclic phosphate phosphodiesterase
VQLTFLGTGTSFGVPVIGCDCPVCTSPDPRDRRTRHGALVTWSEGPNLLVDTPPELRLQLLREGVRRVDAVWFTHGHADHVHGIDDLRVFSLRSRQGLPIYASPSMREELESRFRYIFDPGVEANHGSSKPDLEVREVEEDGEGPLLQGKRVLPLPVPHGSTTVLGFRIEDLGYITDAKTLLDDTLERLAGVRVLVLNALWFGNPHPSHFNVEEALEMAERVGAERTYLTHLTHRTLHAELESRLPPGVFAARDGLTVRWGPEGISESSSPPLP